MKRLLVPLVGAALAASIVVAGCGGSAAPAPTAAPKAAATTAPAAPATTAAPVATKPAAAATTAPVAAKTNFPEGGKAITLIVGSNAGGSSDVGARLLAPGMEKELKVPVNVVNKPGAGWQVGLTELAQSKPDGYTFGMTIMPQTNTIYLDAERKAVFNRKSFQPIGMQVVDPGVIAVASNSKYQTLQDLITDAKANPGKLTASTTGILGDDHLSLLRGEQAMAVKFATVHFTGGAPSIQALLGGHVDVNFNNVGDYMTQVKAGQVRILAILDSQQSKYYPGVKTFKELTGTELLSSSSRGMSVPSATPKEVVDVLAKAFKVGFDNPDHQKKMDDQALSLKYMTPDEMSKFWDEMDSQLPKLMDDARKDPGKQGEEEKKS